ncbi:hypothetical protein Taro_014428 [Colocasia esculenta]|uniref:Glycosyltransferase subfamily 4-like N-terminal domain-containing protein n=1 Tax=Colocasia esculenta TaxID=4460 RepID=A0A843ULU8_COLES|nr:hypothetical protein [Colocasia esculenta]
MTLHLALARWGHELHVFTASPNSSAVPGEHSGAFNLKFHLTSPTAAGYLNQHLFHAENSSGRPFDVVHTESVALFHGRARNITNLAVSWHGIAYETIHFDIIQDILRSPKEPRKPAIAERIAKVIEEVNFFDRYAHHVATSDHVGDVLKRIYWIPEEHIHIIVNGVDEEIYRLDRKQESDFLEAMLSGVPVMGIRFASITGSVITDAKMGYAFLPTVASIKEAVYRVCGEGREVLRKKGEAARSRALRLFTATKMATAYERLFLCISQQTQGWKDKNDYCVREALLCEPAEDLGGGAWCPREDLDGGAAEDGGGRAGISSLDLNKKKCHNLTFFMR